MARKEVRGEIDAIRKHGSQHRSQIAALRRRVGDLERQVKGLARVKPARRPAVEAVAQENDAGAGNLRFSAKGLAAHRKRLGLSAREMGILLDVTALTVYNWESEKTRPRKVQLPRIAAVRALGLREAMTQLKELQGDRAGAQR